MCDPEKYSHAHASEIICALNDTLQGRSTRKVDGLLAELDTVCLGWKDYAEDRDMLHGRIKDFLHQKELLTQPYTKTSDEQYSYEMLNGKKVIDQRLYDQAAKDGFPAGFFRNSLFHQVTLYCLPDGQDCSESVFDSCKFAVCRISNSVSFEKSSFYGCEFHSCAISSVSFLDATVAHTHFHDSKMEDVTFQHVRMKSCNVIDCKLNRVGFLCATLDGCSFGRVTARDIRYLDTAMITQGGATHEEVARNREAIYSALRPQQGGRRELPAKKRGGR